ncbi:TonB-dependent receptor [Sphingobium nicotianae]|uniref:TonB-dependent receptor n=1 Tax=Sphingobium nicotianae TaxID=2782607 RepID=A0A9X1DAV7_9SPHN|nr:TonB-dependent receptor [Sphingobium nicotianae]MBT2186545.1 TonB-dependent receptor [Sphingobium nicotianae]
MKRGESFSNVGARQQLLACSCLAVLTLASQPAAAQDRAPATPDSATSQPATSEPSSGGIETITVTARYVTEDIQKTPMAITAQTSNQLQAANVGSIADLGMVVPNLHTNPGISHASGSPVIVMRGVIQGTTSSYAVAPAVALYVDDIYHATVVGSELDLSDVERVEVNRGPQSTLSGNASIGGSIKIFTPDPKGDGSGTFALTYGSRKKMGASGAIDLGLSSTLSMRLSGNFMRQNGYIDRLDFRCQMIKQGTPELAGTIPFVQPDSAQRGCKIGELGGTSRAGGQVKLRWQPIDGLDVLLSAAYNKQNDQETPEVLAYIDNPYPNNNGLIQGYNVAIENLFGVRYDNRFLPPASNRYATYETFCRPLLAAIKPSGFCYGDEKTQDKATFSGRVRYKVADNVNMTAIASYSEFSNHFTQNAEHSPLGYVISHFDQKVKQKTGEIRFDGNLLDNRLNWVVGGFWISYTGHLGGLIGYLTNNFLQDDDANIESKSAFFHVDYNLTDRWRVSGGARYTRGSVEYELNHPPLITVPAPFTARQRRWDWLLSTDYKITDDVLVYATAATGSRPPGITTIVITPRQLQATSDEELISYEVGVKSEFLDRHLRMNLAAFYTDYSKLSASVQGVECLGQPGSTATWYPSGDSCTQLYPGNPSFAPFYISGGRPASIKGFEWDITAIPVDGLRIDWTGGFNKFKSSVTTPGQPGYLAPGNVRQPEWNMHANVSYDIETSAGTFTPRVDWNWQSLQTFSPTAGISPPNPRYIVPAYSMWNAQIAYKTSDGAWTATLAVSNLANIFEYYQFESGSGLGNFGHIVPPREFSLTVRRRF